MSGLTEIQKADNISKNQSKKNHKFLLIVISIFLTFALFILIFTWKYIYYTSSDVIILNIAAKALNKNIKGITEDDFNKITELHISEKELSNVNILTKFKNLQKLSIVNLYFNKKDLSITETWLAKSGIFDLSERENIDLNPVCKLFNLRTLDLRGNRIHNISFLSNLVNLKELTLDCPCVVDLEPIRGLINLQLLDLGQSYQITDLNPIKGLVNLQSLNLDGTRVSNLEPIKDLTKLQRLYLGGAIHDLDAIKGLTNLLSLTVPYWVSDLEPIRNFEKMQTLNLSSSQVSDLDPIRNFKDLQYLYAGGTKISNVEPVGGLINLRQLLIQYTRVSDIEPVKKLINLEIFSINDCNITDSQIEDLQKALPSLKIGSPYSD